MNHIERDTETLRLTADTMLNLARSARDIDHQTAETALHLLATIAAQAAKAQAILLHVQRDCVGKATELAKIP